MAEKFLVEGFLSVCRWTATDTVNGITFRPFLLVLSSKINEGNVPSCFSTKYMY